MAVSDFCKIMLPKFTPKILINSFFLSCYWFEMQIKAIQDGLFFQMIHPYSPTISNAPIPHGDAALPRVIAVNRQEMKGTDFFACTFIYMLIRRWTLVGVWGIPVSGWLMHSLEHILMVKGSSYVHVAQKQFIISKAWLRALCLGSSTVPIFGKCTFVKKKIKK